MATAILRIDRPLSVGANDRSRDDGVGGETITVSSMGTGEIPSISFWDHWPPPPGTPGASVSMATPTFTPIVAVAGAAASWTFPIPAVSFAAFGIELNVDGISSRRIIAVPHDTSGLIPILFGETGDKSARLPFSSVVAIAKSTFNAGGNAKGWTTRMNEALLWASDAGGGIAAHATSHESGGSDPLTLSNIAGDLSTTAANNAVTEGRVRTALSGLTAAANFNGQNVTGVGSVDGRDVSTDGANLDGLLANAILEGDPRLTDARTPTAHSASHRAAGSDPVEAGILRETSGPTNLTVGAIADGEYARRVGTTLVGGPGGATVNSDVVASVWINEALSSTDYGFVLLTDAGASSVILVNSGGGASATSIRTQLRNAINAAGYTTADHTALPGQFMIRRAGVPFSIFLSNIRLSCASVRGGKTFQMATPRNDGSGTGIMQQGYFGGAFQFDNPAVTYPTFAGANTNLRVMFYLLGDIRAYWGFTIAEMPDGEWEFSGAFGATSSIGGSQGITVWFHPGGVDGTGTDDFGNRWGRSAANVGQAFNALVRTAGNGYALYKKSTPNTGDNLTAPAFKGTRLV